jgi:hypothetical protein
LEVQLVAENNMAQSQQQDILCEQQAGLDASCKISLAYILVHPRHMTAIKLPHMEGTTRAKPVTFTALSFSMKIIYTDLLMPLFL